MFFPDSFLVKSRKIVPIQRFSCFKPAILRVELTIFHLNIEKIMIRHPKGRSFLKTNLLIG